MKWIWIEKEEINSYAEFKSEFDYQSGATQLFVSSDYKYEAFVNGVLVSSTLNCRTYLLQRTSRCIHMLIANNRAIIERWFIPWAQNTEKIDYIRHELRLC